MFMTKIRNLAVQSIYLHLTEIHNIFSLQEKLCGEMMKRIAVHWIHTGATSLVSELIL